MASTALTVWRTTGFERLDELITIRELASQAQAPTVSSTIQLDRVLCVSLVTRFGVFCSGLFRQAVEVHVAAATPGHRTMLRSLLNRGLRLEAGNPRSSTIGADFGRLGFEIVQELRRQGDTNRRGLARLDTLIDYRNAVVHGSEARILALESRVVTGAPVTNHRRDRQVLDELAGTMDLVVAVQLARLLGIGPPW